MEVEPEGSRRQGEMTKCGEVLTSREVDDSGSSDSCAETVADGRTKAQSRKPSGPSIRWGGISFLDSGLIQRQSIWSAQRCPKRLLVLVLSIKQGGTSYFEAETHHAGIRQCCPVLQPLGLFAAPDKNMCPFPCCAVESVGHRCSVNGPKADWRIGAVQSTTALRLETLRRDAS